MVTCLKLQEHWEKCPLEIDDCNYDDSVSSGKQWLLLQIRDAVDELLELEKKVVAEKA